MNEMTLTSTIYEDGKVASLNGDGHLGAPVSIASLYLNGYYVFNGRRYSQAAAYNQSVIQRRSAGSLLAGATLYMAAFDFSDNRNAAMILLSRNTGRIKEETTDPHPYTLCMLHSALGYRERAIADSYAQGTMHRAAHGLSGAFDSAVDINVKQMVLVAERVAYFDCAKEAIYDALTAAGITIAFPQCDVHLIQEGPQKKIASEDITTES